ncbi:YkoF family thiamine/hydroxymethylpyrimidine-binding protein [Thiomicrorhabdus sp. Kp2]|uniref:YkoF family thiamine/hydroxymethylpyrimidine-binding protein n=1 Tax=Thiomicrorhabdus sp. Kp2 TaxID=1123518 RepID=UPI00040D3571|nr:YkoF family thiamine/hydroxymethylpyrimidine-binding protein [Thiomicrorhabdus sp. Kp2]
MKISVDISLYPLQENYREAIKIFIHQIEQMPNVELTANSMSTTLFGDYTDIMPFLKQAMLTTLNEIPESVFVVKLSGGCH